MRANHSIGKTLQLIIALAMIVSSGCFSNDRTPDPPGAKQPAEPTRINPNQTDPTQPGGSGSSNAPNGPTTVPPTSPSSGPAPAPPGPAPGPQPPAPPPVPTVTPTTANGPAVMPLDFDVTNASTNQTTKFSQLMPPALLLISVVDASCAPCLASLRWLFKPEVRARVNSGSCQHINLVEGDLAAWKKYLNSTGMEATYALAAGTSSTTIASAFGVTSAVKPFGLLLRRKPDNSVERVVDTGNDGISPYTLERIAASCTP